MMIPLVLTPDLDTLQLAIGLFGGLAIFLFGMGQMTDALKAVAGEGMRTVLAKLTNTRVTAALTGALVTAVIQSSSITAVLCVGFVSTGLMTLTQSVGVIMGANVGSTVTAQIIAFKVTKYALALVAVGFAFLFVAKRDRPRQIGSLVMGLGLIFLGMDLMSQATDPLRSFAPFIDLMGRMEQPLFGILVGAGFTALVQSSSATTGIVIVLASQGFIQLEAGIALIFGANVGTCVTAILASLGKPRVALRTALAHVSFNLAGVIVWLPFIYLLAEFVRSFSPAAEGLTDSARLAAEVPRQIANAHTLFNVTNTVLFIGFTGVLARLVERIAPDRPSLEPPVVQPLYLDDALLEAPALAVDRLRMEAAHLGELAQAAFLELSEDDAGGAFTMRQVARRVADVQVVHRAIVGYAGRLLGRSTDESVAHGVGRVLAIANQYQSLGDTLGLHMSDLVREFRERHLVTSLQTRRLFGRLHERVASAIELSVRAVRERDPDAVRAVGKMKHEIWRQADDLTVHLAQRLVQGDAHRAEIYRLEMGVLEVFRRVYYFAKRAARLAREETAKAEKG